MERLAKPNQEHVQGGKVLVGGAEGKNPNNGGGGPGGPLSLSSSIIKWTMLRSSKNMWPEDESRELRCIRKDAAKNLSECQKHSKGKKTATTTHNPTAHFLALHCFPE